jgi:hypothetical protein
MISTSKDKISTTNSNFGFSLTQTQTTVAPVYGDDGEELYGAGQFVLAGCYIEVDGIRQICLEQPGILPASLNGRRALYRRLERHWVNISSNNASTNKLSSSTAA